MKELFYNILEELDTLKLKFEIKIIERKVKKMSIMQLNLYFNEIMTRRYNLDKIRLIEQIKSNLKYLEKNVD